MQNELEELQTLLALGLLLLNPSDETLEGILTVLQTKSEVEDMLNCLALLEEKEAMALSEEQLVNLAVKIHKEAIQQNSQAK